MLRLFYIYPQMNQEQLIPHLFRTEFRKITAVLCKTFGMSNLQVAEDIVSDTFLLAAETWGKKGLPDNQVAWLYTVAKNKARDHLRRKQLFTNKISPEVSRQSLDCEEMELDFSENNITDSQLQMLFAICQPSLSAEAQIGLALRILCGFGIEEIAEAFLSNKSTINKRLFRAKENLRKNKVEFVFPAADEIPNRLENVLRTIYLVFSEGYYSGSPNVTLRQDFCLEAMRLNLLLLNHSATNLPQVSALLALMCFQASRLSARSNEAGELVLYDQQDRTNWDKDLIQKGEFYLQKAAQGTQLSKYHLEAAIAYWHTQKDSEEKWANILKLYNYLLQVEYSPAIALNRTYALARVKGAKMALKEALKINLEQSHLYHCLLAELYRKTQPTKAKTHLVTAQNLAKTEAEKALIERKMSELVG